MKKLIFVLFIALLSFNNFSAYAEDPEVAAKPDQELTKKQAEIRITEFQARINDLKTTQSNLDGEIQKLRNDLDRLVTAVKDCNKEYYELVGATEADVANFRQQLGVLEGKVRSMGTLSNDELADRRKEVEALEAEYMVLRNNKIAVLPEFYNRIIDLGNNIKGLYREPSVKKYVVKSWAENRDCLWNIAGNIENYGDPFMWPKIWQANTEIIRNPDIIHPGQELIIPAKSPKTDDEIKAERKYFRQKRAAAARAAAKAAEAAGNEAGTTN